MFKYEFMMIAILVGTLVALVVPFIGSIMIFKRMSMIGEALSHISLAGVILGLILNIDPIIGAVMMTLVAALSIELIRKNLRGYDELALTVITSVGIGLSGILLGFSNSGANFDSFLFGSILTISRQEAMIAFILGLFVIVVSIVFYRQFFMISFDTEGASLSGINVQRYNILFIILTAITVSITSRIVGALIVSSLMIIPVAAALQVCKSYRSTLKLSIIFSVLSVWMGLFIAYLIPIGIKPGGSIVLSSTAILVVVLIIKSFKHKIRH
ncbi:MAG: metal ABC transporter permease [Erysipelothrix sp.]|nr:metal ABC transporter permease [Erysipelothrix sp.]